jgi:hypothetical protein
MLGGRIACEIQEMEAAFICGEELWSHGFGESHSLRPERLKRTYDLLTAYRPGREQIYFTR